MEFWGFLVILFSIISPQNTVLIMKAPTLSIRKSENNFRRTEIWGSGSRVESHGDVPVLATVTKHFGCHRCGGLRVYLLVILTSLKINIHGSDQFD